jgi:hypothetical protein
MLTLFNLPLGLAAAAAAARRRLSRPPQGGARPGQATGAVAAP